MRDEDGGDTQYRTTELTSSGQPPPPPDVVVGAVDVAPEKA